MICFVLPMDWSKIVQKYSFYNRQRKICHKLRNYHITEMPDYLRFNPWILNGYRSPELSTVECFKSIGYLHNETINILSHGIPIVYVVLNYRSIFSAHLFQSYLTYCHIISCLSPWLGSFLYHVLMNHKLGRKVYFKLLQGDMLGIWITQTFGALTTISSSFIMCSKATRYYTTLFYLLLSIYALYKGLTANSAWQRPFSFSLLVFMRVVAFITRLSTQTQTLKDLHIVHVVMQELWPIFGAIIAATRIPERFCPGQFDLFLNSHNIMHCMVVLGAIHMHLAFMTDIRIVLDNPL